MGQEEIFQRELSALMRLAGRQGGCLSNQQISQAFPDSGIDESRLFLIREYLEQNRITVEEEFDPDAYRGVRDRDFAAVFEKELSALPAVTDDRKKGLILAAMEGDKEAKEQLLYVYLPKVAEIARLYAGTGVLQEDLIGEGNLALVAAVEMAECLESAEDADGFFAGMVMDAMEALAGAENDCREKDEMVLERVNRVAEASMALYHELRRKVTPEELAAETDFSMEEIREAYRLSGGQIDTLLMTEEDT